MVPIVTIDPASERRVREALRAFPNKARRAIMRATNRTGQAALTQTTRIISRELGIKAKDLRSPHRFGAVGSQSTGVALRLFKATMDNLTAIIRASGKRIPIVFFKYRATPLTKQQPMRVYFRGKSFIARRRGSGVSWTIGKRMGQASQAFVGRTRRGDALGADIAASGHVGVFARNPGAKRLKIHELKGPSIPHAVKQNEELRRALRVDVSATFNRRLRHELAPILAGKGNWGSGDGTEGGAE